MQIVDWILLVIALLTAIPFGTLAIEALASLLPVRRVNPIGDRPPCVILIPAHDEEAGIATTVWNVLAQLVAGDRILVVADNCSDGTASAASAAGAEVVERTDANRRGKGFALDHGLVQLSADPPAIVVVVDADCELGPNSLDSLVRQATATNRPAQGIYLIGTGKEADPRRRLSAFAVLLKNQIRPLGLHRLGFPCLLTGTGMAFPWQALRSARLGTGNIVEDMKLGVDLALKGHAPRLCPEATLSGAPAPDRGSTLKQRTRWEHGHVQTMLTQLPRLLLGGLSQLKPGLLALSLELAVPPLSLLMVTWAFLLTICLSWWQFADGEPTPIFILFGAVILVGCSLFLAWFKHGRSMLPASTLLLAPLYVAWKIPIYLKMLVAREKKWQRTERIG